MKYVALFLFTCLLTIGVQAQDEVIVLTVNMPRETVPVDFFEPFENRHSGVRVLMSDVQPLQSVSSPAADIDEHLNAVEAYVTTADVLYVSENLLSPHAISAGYFFNIEPLMQTDPMLDPIDFFPAMLESYQWGDGIWAVPVSGLLTAVTYNPEVFDEYRLPYPHTAWTLNDFAETASALADEEIMMAASGAFQRVLLNDTFYAPDSYVPQLNNPALADLVDEWFRLRSDGLIGGQGNPFDFPLVVAPLSMPMPDTSYVWSPLPGDQSILQNVQAFAVSSATEHPELAYELVSFLSNQPELVQNAVPARRSFLEVSDQMGDLAEVALPVHEQYFADYIFEAMQIMFEDNVSASVALAEVQAQAEADLLSASERQDRVLTITQGVLAEQVEGRLLRFGLQTRASTVLYQDEWNDLIRAFAESEPEIGAVNLDRRTYDLTGYIQNTDCFYSPVNLVAALTSDMVLPLDPLVQVDPQFDPNMLFPGIYEQLEVNGQLLGYPLDFSPHALVYDRAAMGLVGLPLLDAGWSTTQFDEAMVSLMPTREPGVSVFQSSTFNNLPLLLLMTAYGGLPIDYSTIPPTIDFTSPGNLAAIQHVLDYARTGAINYQRLSVAGGGGGGRTGGEQGTEPAFYANRWYEGSFLSFRIDQADDYLLTAYPQSADFTPFSYQVGAAYISTQSDIPEICYRFIRQLAARPELFDGLSANTIHIDSGIYADTVRTYYRQLLNTDNLVIFPDYSNNEANINQFADVWFNKAMDAYVLDGQPLLTEMDDAEQRTHVYFDCIEQQQEAGTLDNYVDCIVSTDPALASQLGLP